MRVVVTDLATRPSPVVVRAREAEVLPEVQVRAAVGSNKRNAIVRGVHTAFYKNLDSGPASEVEYRSHAAAMRAAKDYVVGGPGRPSTPRNRRSTAA